MLREHNISGVSVFAVGTTESPGIIPCHWDIVLFLQEEYLVRHRVVSGFFPSGRLEASVSSYGLSLGMATNRCSGKFGVPSFLEEIFQYQEPCGV